MFRIFGHTPQCIKHFQAQDFFPASRPAWLHSTHTQALFLIWGWWSITSSPAAADQLGCCRGWRYRRWTAVGHLGHDTPWGGAAAAGSSCKAGPQTRFASGVGCDGRVSTSYYSAEEKHTGEWRDVQPTGGAEMLSSPKPRLLRHCDMCLCSFLVYFCSSPSPFSLEPWSSS